MAPHYHLVWLWSFLVCIVIIVYSAHAFIAGRLIYVCSCIIIIMLIILSCVSKTNLWDWYSFLVTRHRLLGYSNNSNNRYPLVPRVHVQCTMYITMHTCTLYHVYTRCVCICMYTCTCICTCTTCTFICMCTCTCILNGVFVHVYISMWIIMCIVLCIAAANDVILFSVSVWSVIGCFQCLVSDAWMFV